MKHEIATLTDWLAFSTFEKKKLSYSYIQKKIVNHLIDEEI